MSNTKNGNYQLNCDYRLKLCEHVKNISWWKKILLCRFLFRKDAKIANALSISACVYLYEYGGEEIGEKLLKRSDQIWANIYGFEND